jgi:FtsP/CotA-like multicopper oxidase with cupredoxin domain
MTYSTPYAAYEVELNDTMLQIVENEYRRSENHPLVGTYVDASEVITADGYRRDVITINGQFPGPTIEVMEGAQV